MSNKSNIDFLLMTYNIYHDNSKIAVATKFPMIN